MSRRRYPGLLWGLSGKLTLLFFFFARGFIIRPIPRARRVIRMSKRKPEIREVNVQQMEEILQRAESNTLGGDDTQLLRQLVASYVQFFEMVGDRNTTIARLRKMLFGSTSEKSRDVLSDNQGSDSGDAASQPESACLRSRGTENEEETAEQPATPGHGRRAAEDYRGAEQVEVRHPALAAGDPCPECQGTLYEKPPGVLIRFVGQAPVGATVYRLQKLRCQTCGKTFTAPAPAEAGNDKYDHTAASMIGLLKYGSGLPFNRIQRLQGGCEIPLAASTQWSIVRAAAELMLPAYRELIRQAAQGEVLYNDDTTIRILELMGKRGKQSLLASTAEDSPDLQDPKRSGLFTSGVVSTRAGVRIALFFSGRKHAGENLATVLRQRAAELETPMQMCDGLSRNLPGELKTIVANCLAHARRDFVDLIDRFPAECEYVIRAFEVIYGNDKAAVEQKMSAAERLAHHQAHSQPTMNELHAWLVEQIDGKRVEPNSALGEAINYMRNRWEQLTLFLRQAGAPLDNNLCERALKKCILHRKNSLFYKTQTGAMTGDLYMSLIYTCELNHVSAFDYLNALQLHSGEMAEYPDRWMPWNYTPSLAAPATVA
jgi:hypothetical protein